MSPFDLIFNFGTGVKDYRTHLSPVQPKPRAISLTQFLFPFVLNL